MLPLLFFSWLMCPSLVKELIWRYELSWNARAFVLEPQRLATGPLEVRKYKRMVPCHQRNFPMQLDGPVDAVVVHQSVFVENQTAAIIRPDVEAIDAIPRYPDVASIDNSEVLFTRRNAPQMKTVCRARRLRRQGRKVREQAPGSFIVMVAGTRREVRCRW